MFKVLRFPTKKIAIIYEIGLTDISKTEKKSFKEGRMMTKKQQTEEKNPKCNLAVDFNLFAKLYL